MSTATGEVVYQGVDGYAKLEDGQIIALSNAEVIADLGIGGGGSVTDVSVVTANGVSGTVATSTTTPAITIALGAITPTSVAASGTVTGSNLSGTNTGDQTISLTGDVTGSGTGSFAATIANDAVTYAKIQNVTTNKLLGRATAGSGDVEEITLGTGLSYTGTTLNVTAGAGTVTDFIFTNGGGFTGVVSSSTTTPTLSLTLDNNAITTVKITDANVTLAKIANIGTDRLLGRDTAASGVTEELTVGGGIEFTGSGGIQTSAFTGDVTKTAGGTALTIANDAVTFAKMQNITTDRILGRDTAASGDVEEITTTQILDWLGGTVQGNIIYRNATTWVLLSPGINGQFLQTFGAGANPAWATVTGSGLSPAAAFAITSLRL